MRSFENDQQFIKILETIIEYGSVSKAADYLFISQPSLSKKLKQLERDLGVTLIDRKHHPLRLTEAGEFYLTNLKRLTSQYEAVYHDLTRMASSNHGQLTLGVTQSLGQKILPLILPQYHKVYNDVNIQVIEDTSEHNEERLIHAKIDLYLGILPIFRSDVHYEQLASEPAYLLVPQSHPRYVADQPKQKLASVKDILPFVTDFPYISASENVGFQRLITNTLAENGITLKHFLRCSNLLTIAQLAVRNLGCTIVPKSVAKKVQDIQPANYYELPVDDLSYKLVIAHKENEELTAQMTAFIKMAKGLGDRLLA